MKTSLWRIAILLIIIFSVGIPFMSIVGRIMPYDGEIRYVSAGRNNLYTPYALDVLRSVQYQMQPTQLALNTSWSPNVQYLLLTRSSSATDLLNVEDGTLNPLYRNSILPLWSPDYTHLAFVVQTGELYLANGDGSAVSQFMPEYSANYHDIVYSPDSRYLAYVSNNDLYVMNLADNSVTRLTDSPEIAKTLPIWSLDGQFIAYLWQLDDYYDYHLTVVSLDGHQHADFVSSTRIYTPLWLSDNTHLTFYTRTTETNIFVADINTQTLRQLPISFSLQPIGLSEGLIGEQPTLHFFWYEGDITTFYEDDVDMTTGELMLRQSFVMTNNVSLVLDDWMVGYENDRICIWSRVANEVRDCFAVVGDAVTGIRWLDAEE